MASLHRRPRSKYWHAAWRDSAGKLHMRSTRETNRQKAYVIALGWEHVERTASNEAHVRKVFSEILHRNTGQTLRTPTVREWMVQWLDDKGGETKDRYSGISLAFLTDLGERADRPLVGISPSDIEKYLNTLRKKKVSSKTVALHLQALKSAFNKARRMQVIETSPADPLSVDVSDEIQREVFSESEAKLLIDAAEGEWKTLLRIGYYTGLRLMKAASIRWDTVDFSERTILVAKPGKRGRAVKIPLHDDLEKHLKKLHRSAEKDEYVMPELVNIDSGGKRGLSRAFKAIAIAAGIDIMEVIRPNGHRFCRRSFHSLRHGLVSGLANEGVAPEQRRAITGHKSDSSHARYTHLETETLRRAINKLATIPE